MIFLNISSKHMLVGGFNLKNIIVSWDDKIPNIILSWDDYFPTYGKIL
jgi:hypothetical protein